ncbi:MULTISPECIES: trifunctional transcriptional regulator/proline dehydrogenase/L-glutamate gamma-semialdehyde dehydrogenase [unclassified Massilia]|uniref:trifunctional transcriptional regulator/proline dehydrogenase/L-glutamate gamma-semialdehyde dehydrogenase n=1 Tax=unclassified Massilia TaxID=2609279 RepID=UPI00177DE098|nr:MULTISPECIES: trifunctional transcriptional regulator/proline dehydrogenase/L-glutamate gamma-semialdehyde dehydrogenase [unclassified Massilia]MBD8531793.1 trifunctional transcriptional regulator/proline dehydrogenase/L-glutamate gamma-semialdehyde dehydrogenase [Massilia sp. CFBP 13647]MBD8675238.1 trifunctional transcriptional regulator/proline dehydrogenase/L-glutamate gamma-semialdehyde dehydrogenase [Massilia sp. CFBP 13721]
MQIAATPATTFVPFDAFQSEIKPEQTPLRAAITAAYRRDEREAVQWLLAQGARPSSEAKPLAHRLVSSVRAKRTRASGVDALMHEFSLSSEEGVALMCLAEALLRIPDSATADRLIADKISRGDWRSHLGESPSLFVNAATWGLLITGKLVGSNSERGLGSAMTRLIAKGGEPLIRKGVDLAMRMLGNQFVTGQTIDEALKNSQPNEARGYQYSYDMLGEAALTELDAQSYYASYEKAIHAIGKASNGRGIKDGPGISIKLSALHPRYSRAQSNRVMSELLPRVRSLVLLAKQYDIGINIDAEEADRLEISLDMLEALAFDAELSGFEGIGLVVQGYQKRCPFVIDYVVDLAKRSGRKFMVRLVKGAYWDAEIKRAQVDGMPGYPVYTRKVYTDVSYLTCAEKLLAATDVIYAQFATHNAHTLSVIYTWAQERGIDNYEFQCLHGMGETLYDQVIGKENLNKACRIYAPVGSHETLLAYLVRRLLENGANSSFVNQIVDEKVAIDTLINDPFEIARASAGAPHTGIPLPRALFGTERKNSAGIDLTNEDALRELGTELARQRTYNATPLVAGPFVQSAWEEIVNPAQSADVVGHVHEASSTDVETALAAAAAFAGEWNTSANRERAAILDRVADLFEANCAELMALAVREAGKSLPNAIAEIREAVDFLRYYGAQVKDAVHADALGPVTCISPWNFPLAIFTGQVAAALAAGNVVLAKPAEQTPLIAHRAVELFYEAGIPRAALQLLPGRGEVVGAALTADPRVKGVIFTGSTEVAQLINRTLAKRGEAEGIDIPLVAETGGQNALIVDSSALPEQVVQDVLSSAFDSAGQRCSALRVLFLQEDIADKTIRMLKGALTELRVGSPDRLATDIGPVIDAEAQRNLLAHIERTRATAKQHFALELPASVTAQGTFVPPTVLEISSLGELKQEVFGPVLHIVRYRRADLPQVVDAINATGYGLTLGIHSRIDETIDFITTRAHVGNIYVNRNIVGAVVGVQPFGGEGKSGTGPKAGGPLYIKRLQRQAAPLLMHSNPAYAALSALLVWARSNGHGDIVSLGEGYARTQLNGTTIALPGPTGEKNSLAFFPRGVVLCAAGSVKGMLNQLAAALATGNRAFVLATSQAAVPEGLPPEVKDRIRFIGAAEVANCEFGIALLEAGLQGSLRTQLAARNGAIVGIVDTDAASPVALWRLVAERAVCVNTTAAGGNASLMTLGL